MSHSDSDSDSPQPDPTASGFTPALAKAFRERLKPCLNALDALRVQGLQKEISLPAIAVVGDQSVGKSSVLEAISGVEFPRGTGIVTRCPLMLSMRSREDDKWFSRIRYETKAGDLREKPISCPKDIGDMIREAQNEMAGTGGDISDKLIEMWVESGDSPDLTLIDLPGIARYSAELGVSVASITKSLILSFIEKPEVIILVVVPCHVDIETVEALSLAKEVDPDSRRTIGVLTCPDLVNPGSEPEVLEMMRNQKIVLRKGYVTVRCRTPQQLKENVTLREACGQEDAFFKTHKYFCALDEYEYGCKTLALKLSTELFNAIRSDVPEMIKEIQIKREEFSKQLETLGTGPPEEEPEMKKLLVRMITKFSKEFNNVATGIHRHEPDRLYGRCRMHWEMLADAIENCAFSEKTDTKEMWRLARKEIEEQRGCELPGFDNVFPVLQRIVNERFLALVREPSSAFLVSVNQEVDETIRTLSDRIFADYPALNQHVKEVSEGIRSNLVGKARRHMKKIFKQEEYVFTQDRIYVREKVFPSNERLQLRQRKEDAGPVIDKSRQAQNPRAAESAARVASSNDLNERNERNERNSEKVLEGVEAYVRVAVRRLQDMLTLVVMHFLLYKMAAKLNESLCTMMTDPAPLFVKLHAENPLISAKRRQLRERLANLAQAEQELAKF